MDKLQEIEQRRIDLNKQIDEAYFAGKIDENQAEQQINAVNECCKADFLRALGLPYPLPHDFYTK